MQHKRVKIILGLMMVMVVNFFALSSEAKEIRSWPALADCQVHFGYMDLNKTRYVEEQSGFVSVTLIKKNADSKFARGEVSFLSKKSAFSAILKPGFEDKDFMQKPLATKTLNLTITLLKNNIIISRFTIFHTANDQDNMLLSSATVFNPEVSQIEREFVALPKDQRRGQTNIDAYRNAFPGTNMVLKEIYAGCSIPALSATETE